MALHVRPPPVRVSRAPRAGRRRRRWTARSVDAVGGERRERGFERERRAAAAAGSERGSGAFYLTLVPIRPRRRGERRSLRTSPVASLRPGSLAFNPDTPRRLSTPLLTPLNSTPTFARTERPSARQRGLRRDPRPRRHLLHGVRAADVPVAVAEDRAEGAEREVRRHVGTRGVDGRARDRLRRRGVVFNRRALSMRCVLYTGPHTTALARWTPILEDFARRVSPPTPPFQYPPSAPFNSN